MCSKFHNEQVLLSEMEGNLLVSCPAGWGKTFYILEYAKANPKQNILILMFNRKIMQEVEQAAKAANITNVTVSTFHTYGNSLLKNYTKYHNPDMYPDYKTSKYYRLASWIENQFKEQLSDYKARLKERGERVSFPSKVCSIIELAQRENIFPSDMSVEVFTDKLTYLLNTHYVHNEVFEPEHFYYAHYILARQFNDKGVKFVTSSNGKFYSNVSFSDMLYFPNYLKTKSTIQYDTLIVDEFQDLTPSFLGLILNNKDNIKRFMAFGDLRQDINRWNGARTNEIVNLLTTNFNAKLVEFNATYRYGSKIAEGINQYFGYNIKTLKNAEGNFNLNEALTVEEFITQHNSNAAFITFKNTTCAYTFLYLTSKGHKVGIFNSELQATFTSMCTDLQSEKFEDIKKESDNKVIERRNTLLNRFVKFEDIPNDETYKSLQIFSDFVSILKLNKPQLVQYIKEIFNVNPDKEKGVIITTSNKAKGLTFSNIALLNEAEFDKVNPELHNRDLEVVQRINLKYVALTRATDGVYRCELEIPPKYSEVAK
jgi:superfamily I DNA/RNA helicase